MTRAALAAGEFPGCLVAKVMLDGVEQRGVIEADPERGFVVRGVRGQDGRYVFDRGAGEFVTERVEGVVTLSWRDPALAEKWLRHHGLDPSAYTAA